MISNTDCIIPLHLSWYLAQCPRNLPTSWSVHNKNLQWAPSQEGLYPLENSSLGVCRELHHQEAPRQCIQGKEYNSLWDGGRSCLGQLWPWFPGDAKGSHVPCGFGGGMVGHLWGAPSVHYSYLWVTLFHAPKMWHSKPTLNCFAFSSSSLPFKSTEHTSEWVMLLLRISHTPVGVCECLINYW